MRIRRKINFDYLQLWKEAPLYWGLILYGLYKRDRTIRNGRVLIVNPCPIGDFVSTLPAIADYISRHPRKRFDLVVSPPLLEIAGHVRGLERVFTATSIFGRTIESVDRHTRPTDLYEQVILMRSSSDLFVLLQNLSFGTVRTGVRAFSRYGSHVGWSIVRGQTPRRWTEVAFHMLGGTPNEIPFDTLFAITSGEYARADTLPALQTREKKVLVHMGASWIMNRWKREYWVELLEKIHAQGDIRIIFVGGQADEGERSKVAEQLSFPTYSLIGCGLFDLLVVMRRCNYFIGTDSGPRNMAHAADLPSVVLLGPAPHMWTPPNPRDIALDRSGGRGVSERFVEKKHSLVNTITPQEAYEAFITLSQH